MMPSKIKPSKLKDRAKPKKRLNIFQQARAKKQYELFGREYGKLAEESQQYAESLGNLQETTYYPMYEFNEELEMYVPVQADYSEDIPIKAFSETNPVMELKTNPEQFLQKYGAGEYDDYFEQNPQAQAEIRKYIEEQYVPERNKAIQQRLQELERRNIILQGQQAEPINISQAKQGVKELTKSTAALSKEYADIYSQAAQEEREFTEAENKRLQDIRDKFSKELAGYKATGDYAEQLLQFSEFSEKNKPLIEGSRINYEKYLQALEKSKDIDRYASQYRDNPDYELITQNGKTIIRTKPQEFLQEKEWYRDDGKEYEYGTYVPHELEFQNGDLIRETFRATDLFEKQADEDYKRSIFKPYTTKELTFSGGNIKTKKEFGLWKPEEFRQGKVLDKRYETYLKGEIDFEKQMQYAISQPRGFKYIAPVPKKVKTTTPVEKNVFITPSNLFGTSNNLLGVGEFELTTTKAINRQPKKYTSPFILEKKGQVLFAQSAGKRVPFINQGQFLNLLTAQARAGKLTKQNILKKWG